MHNGFDFWNHSPVSDAVLATTSGQPGSPDPSLIVAGKYILDADHTIVTWAVNRMGLSILEGQFRAAAGSMTICVERAACAAVDVTFNIDELSVGVPAFARRLKSADLFDLARFPTARFVSTSMEALQEDRATVLGDLTLKGVTRQVALDSSFVGAGFHPDSGSLNCGFCATAVLRRSDFDLGFMVPTVSDGVRLRIAAAFVASSSQSAVL